MQMYAPPGVNAVTSATTGQPYTVAPGGAINALVQDVPDLLSRGFTLQRMPFVLAQSGVPVILPSSGSSNASGQITHTTALPYQPSGTVQVYLPAGVVVGDATGGLYSAVYSSTTVCQLVGNPTTANGAYTQSTSGIVVTSIALPAGSLGPNGSLRARVLTSLPNNANTKLTRIYLGPANFGFFSATTTGATNSVATIQNRGSQASQVVPVNSGPVGSGNLSSVAYSTVDTSSTQPVTINMQLSVATDYMILESYTFEVLAG